MQLDKFKKVQSLFQTKFQNILKLNIGDGYIKFTKKFIIIFIGILIVVIFSSSLINSKKYQKIQDYSNIIDVVENETHKQEFKLENTQVLDSTQKEWYIEIPKIELFAKIASGTSDQILNEYVGHFEDTAILYGNVGLAAHNRGYKVNYFAKIKELEKGDIVYYCYDGKKQKYEIVFKEIIKETNWEFLSPTKENRLTLITCVEDMPELRRCIQAIEVK